MIFISNDLGYLTPLPNNKCNLFVVRVDVTEMLIRPLSFDFDPKKISSLHLTTRLRVVWEYCVIEVLWASLTTAKWNYRFFPQFLCVFPRCSSLVPLSFSRGISFLGETAARTLANKEKLREKLWPSGSDKNRSRCPITLSFQCSQGVCNFVM